MKRAALVPLSLCALAFVTCRKDEPAPNLTALQFPVAVLFENSSTRLCGEPAELTTMHTNAIVLNDAPPFAIDSQFRIYSLERFRSTHGGLWLMANPSGSTEVTFDLKPQKSGRENARALFAKHLQKQTWQTDLPELQKSLAAKQTLAEMVAVVQRQPEKN
jgi:hypothetical protein